MRIRLMLICLVAVGFANNRLAAAETDDKELAKFQGDWTAEVDSDQGKQKATMTITGTKLRFDVPTGEEWYEGTFEIDAKAKPKRISVLIEDCPIKEFKKKTVEGIYTIEDKTLTICATAPGSSEGPSGFDDEKARTLVFKKNE